MSEIDRQLDDYAALDDFRMMLMGLLSVGARFAALAPRERSDGEVAPECALADFILGVLSTDRTLRAALGEPPRATNTPPGEGRAATTSAATTAGWLR